MACKKMEMERLGWDGELAEGRRRALSGKTHRRRHGKKFEFHSNCIGCFTYLIHKI